MAISISFVFSFIVSVCLAQGKVAPAPQPIMGVVNATPGQFPFFAHIRVRTDAGQDGYSSCGGSLISPTLILTAAQCCLCDKTDASFEITLNPYRFNRTNVTTIADSCTKTFISTSRRCHTDFVSNASPKNDFCLITLPRRATYTPIVVYDSSKQKLSPRPDVANKSAVIVGMGSMIEDASGEGASSEDGSGETTSNDLPSTLQKAVVSVTNSTKCAALWANEGITLDSSRLICENGTGSQDFCAANAGSPMFTRMTDGRFLLLGVASSGCSGPNLPGYYGRVDTDSYRTFAQAKFAPTPRPPTAKPTRRTPTQRPSKLPTGRPSARLPSTKTAPTRAVPSHRPSAPTKAPTLKRACVVKQFP